MGARPSRWCGSPMWIPIRSRRGSSPSAGSAPEISTTPTSWGPRGDDRPGALSENGQTQPGELVGIVLFLEAVDVPGQILGDLIQHTDAIQQRRLRRHQPAEL